MRWLKSAVLSGLVFVGCGSESPERDNGSPGGKHDDVAVVADVAYLNATTLTVSLSPPVSDLDVANFGIAPDLDVLSAQRSDSSGGSYSLTTSAMAPSTTYTLSISREGYAFSGDLSIEAPAEPPPSGVTLVQQERFIEAQLDATEWEKWNTLDIANPDGVAMLQSMTRRLYGAGVVDQYQTIIFILNNAEYPAGRPTGQFIHVKNTVAGIGIRTDLDETSGYGATQGTLEGVLVLYRRNGIFGVVPKPPPETGTTMSLGPVLHELAHRYANFVVPNGGAGPHWNGTPAEGTGRLSGFGPYSGIELYLMGLTPATSLTGSDLEAYNSIPEGEKERNPDSTTAPKARPVLVVVVTPDTQRLADGVVGQSDAGVYNDGVRVLVSTDFDSEGLNPGLKANNYYEQTGRLGTLEAPLPAVLAP